MFGVPRKDDDGWINFNNMVKELSTLNLKVLQMLNTDLRVIGAINPWTGEYHRVLKSQIETMILERTVFK